MKSHVSELAEKVINVKDINKLCALGGELISTKCQWCDKDLDKVIVKLDGLGGIYTHPVEHICKTFK